MCRRNNTSCINTFTGEICVGFVLLFSLFGGAGCLVFGHQVLWDSQGASTDGQLKQSLGQPVTWHLQQEVLDVLDWKLNKCMCQRRGYHWHDITNDYWILLSEIRTRFPVVLISLKKTMNNMFVNNKLFSMTKTGRWRDGTDGNTNCNYMP